MHQKFHLATLRRCPVSPAPRTPCITARVQSLHKTRTPPERSLSTKLVLRLCSAGTSAGDPARLARRGRDRCAILAGEACGGYYPVCEPYLAFPRCRVSDSGRALPCRSVYGGAPAPERAVRPSLGRSPLSRHGLGGNRRRARAR